MKRVLVIGGGPAGIFAAIFAARAGAAVTLWEKNDRLGRKLAITGKGRCNLTNNCSLDEIIKNLTGNGRFMYSALNCFDNQAVMSFFEGLGVPLKIERGGRVFPFSDKAADIVLALERELKRLGVRIEYKAAAGSLLLDESKSRVLGAVCGKGKELADCVILATGGATYRATGSSGDGYRLARQAGHSVTDILPSLVPLVSSEPWIEDLAGLSLKNVAVAICDERDKRLGAEFGELLFTHFGLSGPCILTLSDTAARYWLKRPQQALTVKLDLKPALSREQLDSRLLRDFLKNKRRIFTNSLDELLPKSMIPVVVQRSGIEPGKIVCEITKEERQRLLLLLKCFTVCVVGTRPLNEGIVTAGGVSVKEIVPQSFASRKVQGLYVVGELLDVHGFTGGYNLQAAFSGGYAAGCAAAKNLE